MSSAFRINEMSRRDFPTAATTAATTMNPIKRPRTNPNERPMNHWLTELGRTMLNGSRAMSCKGSTKRMAETAAA
jgi:hypothetical protein